VTAAPPAASSPPGLLRAIGRWDLTAAILNAVIGSSIFGYPAIQASLTGAWSPAVYVLAGLGILTIVLCFAEVASRFQDAGGPYLYVREAFGPFLGFQAGWLTFWIRATAAAANLNLLVDYLAQVAPATGVGWGRGATMTAVIGLVTCVNIIGVRPATWTVDVFTLAKLLPLGLLIAIGLPAIRSEVLATQGVAHPQWTEAILLLMFAYGGFESPLIPAGEAVNPRRDTARALLVALAVIATLYTLIQLVAIGVVPHVASSRAPLADAFRILLGPAAAGLASLAATVSVWGYMTGTVLQSPRVLFAMAERRELPSLLARVHPRFRTPAVAILTYSSVSLALAAYGSFVSNATLSAIVRLITYGLTCTSLLVFRVRRPADRPAFALRAAWPVATAAVLFCGWLLTTRTLEQAWILAGLVAGGSLLWWSARRRTMCTS
jgi:APA family basic amino acid/polyamine antiporter